MKSWRELLLQEITPALDCLIESPTRPEFRIYTLLLRTFGEIFKVRKSKVITPQTKSKAGKDCFALKKILKFRVYVILSPKACLPFCHLSVNSRRRHLR